MKSQALKTNEMSWESGHFGGHRLEGEYLRDYALILIPRNKVREGVFNQ